MTNSQPTEAKHLKLVCIGHIDHGKSSLIGRLFYDTGNLSEVQMKRINLMAKELGREGYEYAFVMDQLKKEREQGITMSVGHKKLLIDNLSITFADAPGHKDFIKNMLAGTAESDAAILVVAADEGIQPQTRAHLYLTKLLGLEHLIILINKLDLFNYSQRRYQKIASDVKVLLQKMGFLYNQIPIVPGSALYGENIIRKSRKIGWYKSGCVLDMIKELPPKANAVNLPLRLPIQGQIYIKEKNAVMGRIVSGRLKKGDEIIVEPGGNNYVIKTIFLHNKAINKAYAGDNIFLILDRDVSMIKRGDIIGHPEQIPTITKEFLAQIILLDHGFIKQGFKAQLELQTESIPIVVKSFKKLIDTQTGEIMRHNPKVIRDGESAQVEIVSFRPLFIENQNSVPALANFVLTKFGRRIAMGVCFGASEG